jgi:UDP-2,3-diacylglucosamine hydrolase
LAQFSSRSSRAKTGNSDEKFSGKENEWLYLYSQEYLKTEPIDYFIFGHRHLPLRIRLNERSEYINIGEWLKYDTYAYFDGKEFITVGEFILD